MIVRGVVKFVTVQSRNQLYTLISYYTIFNTETAMKLLKKCVLLLKAEKSEEAEDKYESVLMKAGFDVKHLKTLDFKFKNLDELRNKLNKPNNYSGIIFTTPRSVKALCEALNDKNLDSNWRLKYNYVVGETTYEHALNECGLNCKGQESGNAKKLADVIINDKSHITQPLLFPCGNLKTDTLINDLSKEDVAVDTVTVYETVPSPNLEEDFIQITSNYTDIPEYFVYFSPSGVKSTLNFIQKLNLVDAVKFIAIGPTTEAALKNQFLQVNSVALKPTPHDLLDAIIK